MATPNRAVYAACQPSPYRRNKRATDTSGVPHIAADLHRSSRQLLARRHGGARETSLRRRLGSGSGAVTEPAGTSAQLLNCRGDGRRGNAGFGGAGGNRTLGDVEAHPTVGGERRLAATRPDAFLPDLATSLNNIGAISVRLGGKIRLGSGAAFAAAFAARPVYLGQLPTLLHRARRQPWAISRYDDVTGRTMQSGRSSVTGKRPPPRQCSTDLRHSLA
jgi:hypothetical protein